MSIYCLTFQLERCCYGGEITIDTANSAVFITFAASRQKRNVPTRFVSKILRTVSKGVNREWFMEAIPALLTRTFN